MFNYGEYIFHQLLNSEFIKLKLCDILISLTVSIIKFHLVSIFCMIFSIHPFIDFFTHIIISVSITVNSNYLYLSIEKYKPEYLLLTKYIIDNYTIDNYIIWKRYITIFICLYSSIIFIFIELNNLLVIMYIIQYLISFFIIEKIEQNYINDFIIKYRKIPVLKVNKKTKNNLINSYISLSKSPQIISRCKNNPNVITYSNFNMVNSITIPKNIKKDKR